MDSKNGLFGKMSPNITPRRKTVTPRSVGEPCVTPRRDRDMLSHA